MSIEQKVERVEGALGRGDITTADILSRECLEENPAHVGALRARLQVLSKTRNFVGAVDIIARLINILGGSRDLFFEGAYYAELGGNYELALKGYEQALELEPCDVLALLGLGRALLNSVGVGGADTFFARALELEPDNQDAAEYLALAYEKESDFTRGIPFCTGVLEQFPESWMLQVVLGNLYSDSGRSARGMIYIAKALELNPEHAKPYVSAAAVLNKMGRPFEALSFLEKARDIAPADLNILLEQAALLRATGRSREALEALEKVFRYVPNIAQARSNYLYFMHDINGISPERIYTESRRYEEDICAEIVPLDGNFQNTANPERQLIIGFLSADFREHSVAYFLLPLFEELDKTRYRLIVFNSNTQDDAYTERFRELASETLAVRDMSDQELAEAIRERKVDILIELGGHTAGTRLNVCAYRPAPVQLNWLGYPGTTGLSAVEYRIVDAVTDPCGESECYASEELIRMERGFLCYQPPRDVPEIAPLPVLENSYITFGAFSNMAKINPDMIALWAQLLKDNPQSKLFLKNKALTEEQGRAEISSRFAAQGIDPERLLLKGVADTTCAHLEQYALVDIALDTFPYNGTTTIFEALYMGVPVVGLSGKTHGSRVGASILTRTGLEQLVARTPQQYLQIATALARQIEDLQGLRTGMRSRLEASGLLDKERFARDFSTVLDDLWGRWVRRQEKNSQ